MHARLSLFTVDPAGMGELISYLRQDFAPVVEREPGSRGVAGLVDRDRATVLLQSLWANEDTLQASGKTISSPEHFASFFGASMAIQQFTVASVVHRAVAGPGAGVRVVHLDTSDTDDPGKVLIGYEQVASTWLTEFDGLCNATLLLAADGSAAGVARRRFVMPRRSRRPAAQLHGPER